MKARSFIARNLIVACAALAPFAVGAQEVIRMTVSSGHSPVFVWVKHLKATLMPTVDAELAKTGQYKMAWTEAYGGTLAKLGSELQTVGDGISDMGMVNTLFHMGDMPLQNIGYLTPFGATDPEMVCDVMDETHKAVPEMEAAWTKHNLVRLVSHCYEDYGMVSKFPIQRLEDMDGRKIGGAGPASTWIKGTGASSVNGNFATYYNDLKSGVFDAGIVFLSGAEAGRHFEVAPNYIDIGFGAVYAGGVAVNKARWDAFPDEVKQAFKVGADAYRVAYFKETRERIASSKQAWTKGGGTILPFAPEERIRIAQAIDNPVTPWLATSEKANLPARQVVDAYMGGFRSRGVEFARDWDKE